MGITGSEVWSPYLQGRSLPHPSGLPACQSEGAVQADTDQVRTILLFSLGLSQFRQVWCRRAQHTCVHMCVYRCWSIQRDITGNKVAALWRCPDVLLPSYMFLWCPLPACFACFSLIIFSSPLPHPFLLLIAILSPNFQAHSELKYKAHFTIGDQ